MPRRRVDEATFSKASVVTIPSLDGYLKPVTVYGKSTQAGTPTPDVPVPIVSTTGNVTVRSDSKNLVIVDNPTQVLNGITFTVNSDKSVTINGTATADVEFKTKSGVTQGNYIRLEAGRTYSTRFVAGGSDATYFSFLTVTFDDNTVEFPKTFGVTGTYTPAKSGWCGMTLKVRLGTTVNNVVAYPQLEVGSVATVFEKNTTSTQTLPLGTTQLRSLPNGVSDRIYKSGGSWWLEQNVGSLTLDGSEAWSTLTTTLSTSYGYFYTTAYDALIKDQVSPHPVTSDKFATFSGILGTGSAVSADSISGSNTADTARIRIFILLTRLSANTTAAFKTWLGSNNSNVLYQLTTPITTAITDPTLITALENIRTYQGVTNITAGTPVSGVYLPNSLRTTATNRVAVQDMKASVYNTSGGMVVSSNASTAVVGDATHRTYSWGCWVKLSSRNVAATVLWAKSNTKYSCQFRVEAGGKIRAAVYDGTASTIAQSSVTYVDDKWHSLVGVRSDNTLSLYIDGLLIKTVNGTIGDTNEASSFVMNGNNTNGSMSDTWFTFNALSTQDILNYHLTGIIGYPCLFRLPLQEGSGTTAYDSSGNGNHATVNAGTYTADVPTKKRELVGGNLVYNGDFEYVPQVNTAQTIAGLWIDGTAGGSSTNFIFGWACNSKTGTVAVKFDTTEGHDALGSIKLSTAATGSQVRVSNTLGSIMSTAISPIFSVLPSTSYTYSFWMKTNYVSGDATTGAQINFIERTASSSSPANTSTVGVKTTTDWTRYTGTITTNSATRFLTPDLRVTGNDGAGTLIMDAWFDDITLTPTVKPTRGIAG